MNVITRAKPKAKITAQERELRREIVEHADAHNRIEGLARGPDTNAVFDAFVSGDLEVTDIVPRLKALHNVPR